MAADDPIEVGVVTDVGELAKTLAAFFTLADRVFTIVNSPTMLAARQRADVQAILNKQDEDMAQAHKTGDFTQVDQDVSG